MCLFGESELERAVLCGEMPSLALFARYTATQALQSSTPAYATKKKGAPRCGTSLFLVTHRRVELRTP